MGVAKVANNWASEASPTLGCSIEISRDISESAVALSIRYSSEPNTKVYWIRPHLFKLFFFSTLFCMSG